MNWLDHTKTVTLEPHDVDLDDRTYLIPCFQDLGPLVSSIQRIGIVNAPLLEQYAKGCFRPVFGRRRIQAAQRIGLGKIEARVLIHSIPEAEGFLIALWDNLGHRTFDTSETAVIVRKLLDFLPRDQAASKYFPLLGVPPKGPRIERLCAVGALEDRVLEALSKGRILEKTAVVLSDLNHADRQMLLGLVEGLRLNANKSAEIIDHLVDLSVFQGNLHARESGTTNNGVRSPRAVRTGVACYAPTRTDAAPNRGSAPQGNSQIEGIRAYLESPAAQEILQDERLSVPERADRFRVLVRSWKFPELVAREREFKEWLDGQPHLKGVSIRPTQAFEDEKCTITITADSREEAEHILARLSS